MHDQKCSSDTARVCVVTREENSATAKLAKPNPKDRQLLVDAPT
jgi:hypothetical protein